MLKGKYTRKAVAATLLLIMLTDIVAPSVSYALTSGPTAPEATSFEPIDTTDMVNLQTGDLTYNIPLIEVPGPEGGYPLSLSYHAGIQPNEDASWVGLGWTLNPGAVNRSVNGYPDDWYNPTTTSHVYWAGGSTTTYNIGVSVGLTGTPLQVGVGLSISNDTYKGFGVGGELTLGTDQTKTIYSASVSVGVSPYIRGGYATANIGVGRQINDDIGVSVGMNVSTNFESVSVGMSGGVYLGGGLLGVSMGTGSDKPSLSVMGASSSVHNGNAGNISTSLKQFDMSIPVGKVNINLGYSKERYWTNETVGVATHGSLHTWAWSPPSNTVADNNIAYDEYALLDDPAYKNMFDYPDPKRVQGGSFPAFDVYSVNAQGLGGSMRPYLYQAEILNQNIRSANGGPDVAYWAPKTGHFFPEFRFDNDFSNSYRQNYIPYSNPASLVQEQLQPFDPSPVFGNNDGNFGFNGGLVGSRHVFPGVKVHPSLAMGYTGPVSVESLEGFSITNESGVTYHYGLPAYAKDEEIYQEKIERHPNGGVDGFSRQTKAEPYAYTWYLTTVTGPDFVDRNANGMADGADWGYWVNFEYGKWSQNYFWRNPSTGFRTDEDNKWQNCSVGRKEVYYLNAIKTRTHAAIFEKDLRLDGKGVSPEAYHKKDGWKEYLNFGSEIFNVNSSQSLKLDKVYLVNASDANAFITSSGNANLYIPQRTSPSGNEELPHNILDKNDVDAIGRSTLEAKAIRIIDFKYDYSLSANTLNSYNSMLFPLPPNAPIAREGKLTLKSVETGGKRGLKMIPPTQFSYELGPDEITSGTLTGVSFTALNEELVVTCNTNFEVGDLVNISPASTRTWRIKSKPTSNTYLISVLKNQVGEVFSPEGLMVSGSVMTTTKNPPYKSNAYDMWYMFKADYDPVKCKDNENLGRQTTTVSSKHVDAWSLRSINTPLGSQVRMVYESKNYKRPILNDRYSLVANNIMRPSGFNNRLKITFANVNEINLSSYFTIGVPAELFIGLQSISPQSVLAYSSPMCAWSVRYFENEVFESKKSANVTNVVDIGSDYITVENADFTNYYQTPIQVYNMSSQTIMTTCEVNKRPVCANTRIVGDVSNYLGGGIRVKSINSLNNGTVFTAKYDYTNPNTGVSSGVVSYEPTVFETVDFLVNNSNTEGVAVYKKSLYRDMNNILTIAREVPPPGVMHEYVKVTTEVKNPNEATRIIEGSMQFQFEVYRENMSGRVNQEVTGNYTIAPGRTRAVINNGSIEAINTRNLALMNFTSAIGNTKRIIQYDNKGKKISETVNHYLHDGLEDLPLADFMTQYKARLSQYYYQGYLQERYSQLKAVYLYPNTNNYNYDIQATLSGRESYPSIPTGQTTLNYVNGTQTSSKNLGFDFYSGALTKTVEKDANGNNFMAQTIPAWRKYPEMGPMAAGNSNATKNMLIQNAESYVWKVDDNNNTLGLVSSSVTTWSNQISALGIDGTSYIQNNYATNGNVWRKQSSYNWLSDLQSADGLTALPDFSDFNFASPGSSHQFWKKTSEVTLYDVYSKGIEVKDINSNFAATKMGYNATRVLVTGGPSKYDEIAFSGAEDNLINGMFGGNVSKGGGFVANYGVCSPNVHTGDKSLSCVGQTTGFTYTVNISKLTQGNDYMAYVWAKRHDGTGRRPTAQLYYQVDNNPPVPVPGLPKNIGVPSGKTGWYLISTKIPASAIATGSTLTVFCKNNSDEIDTPMFFDDFKFQPFNAATNAYVYDNFSGELTYVLDNDNLFSKFEYDASGRLIRTYKESFLNGQVRQSEKDYNFKKPSGTFTNAARSGIFYSVKCLSTEQPPLAITYTVRAGKYISTVSQTDADNMAQKDIDLNGQCYANNNGLCTVGNTIYYNVLASAVFTKNNCPPGQVGSSVTYTVPANTFSSTVSQAEADLQAQNNINTYGQAYANTHGTCTSGIFYNVQASANFTRNNCGMCYTGSTVTYTVAAGTYSSTVSQAAADALAQADINANGQAYANVHGTCMANGPFVYYNVVTSGTFQKQCKAGQVGTFVTYTVPANTYCSTTSQAHADFLAQQDVNANGQAYANANGICQ